DDRRIARLGDDVGERLRLDPAELDLVAGDQLGNRRTLRGDGIVEIDEAATRCLSEQPADRRLAGGHEANEEQRRSHPLAVSVSVSVGVSDPVNRLRLRLRLRLRRLELIHWPQRSDALFVIFGVMNTRISVRSSFSRRLLKNQPMT